MADDNGGRSGTTDSQFSDEQRKWYFKVFSYCSLTLPIEGFRKPVNTKNLLCVNIMLWYWVALGLSIIFVWIWFNEGQYEFSGAHESQTIIDQYGSFQTNFSKDQFETNLTDDQLNLYNRFWVPNDYIKQSNDEDSFTVYTNFGIANVSLGTCPEDPQFDVVICDPNNNTQCKPGKLSPNGIQTGNCVKTTLAHIDKTRWNVCEVKGWYPVAIWPPLKRDEGAILKQTKDTVISIQNFIHFPAFDVKMRTTERPALDCLYDPEHNKHCPYFKLSDIVKYSTGNSKSYEDIAAYPGAIFEIRIEWSCIQLLNTKNEKCQPEFSFSRIDNENSDPPSLWTFWNFEKIDPARRVLTYGWRIKFEIFTTGYVKRFSYFKLATQVAAYSFVFGFMIAVFRFFTKRLTSKVHHEKDKAKFCDKFSEFLGRLFCKKDRH
jgi:hypothetical protein